MKKLILFVLALTPALAQRVDLELEPRATTIGWTLGDVLHTVHGTFRLQKGDIWFDSPTGKAGGVLVVNAASGESGSNARDSRMHKNVLESAKYPEITFAPDRLRGTVATTGDSEVELHGLFTIHGGTHELEVRVKSHAEAGKVTASLTFSVPYVKWGMKDPSTFVLKVKDAVMIDVQAAGRIR